MTWKGKGRELEQYTSELWPEVSEDLAQKMLEVGGGSVWRFRPPSSPEWPPGLWSYVVGATDLSAGEIEEWIAGKYVGDWAPDKVQWTIERLDRVKNAKREVSHRSFDWPNPMMTVVANKARGRLKRPKLVDAYKMAKEYPRTFELPSKRAVADLEPGDFAKVTADGERFWVRVTKRDGSKFQGTVDNDLVMTEDHGMRVGDRISFEAKHLYDAVSKERMNRAHAEKLAANPLGARQPNQRRRSDMVRDLEKRLRRLKSHLDSVEDILERGRSSPDEREVLLVDKESLEKTVESIEGEIDQLEVTIELEGDIIGEVPLRPAWGIPRRSNQGADMNHLEQFTSKELKKMPTLSTGQAEDLKHDDGEHRWWLDRVGPDSGATHRVAVEELVQGRWKVVHQYEPYRNFNKTATAERLKRF